MAAVYLNKQTFHWNLKKVEETMENLKKKTIWKKVEALQLAVSKRKFFIKEVFAKLEEDHEKDDEEDQKAQPRKRRVSSIILCKTNESS